MTFLVNLEYRINYLDYRDASNDNVSILHADSNETVSGYEFLNKEIKKNIR